VHVVEPKRAKRARAEALRGVAGGLASKRASAASRRLARAEALRGGAGGPGACPRGGLRWGRAGGNVTNPTSPSAERAGGNVNNPTSSKTMRRAGM